MASTGIRFFDSSGTQISEGQTIYISPTTPYVVNTKIRLYNYSSGSYYYATDGYTFTWSMSPSNSNIFINAAASGNGNSGDELTIFSIDDAHSTTYTITCDCGSYSSYFYMIVSDGSGDDAPTVDSVVVSYGNVEVSWYETVYIDSGDSIQLSAVVNLSDGSNDSSGVRWSFSSGSRVSVSSYNSSNALLYDNENTSSSSTMTVQATSVSDSSVYKVFYVTVKENVVTSIELYYRILSTMSNNAQASKGQTIELKENYTLRMLAYPYFEDNSYDSAGVTWSLNDTSGTYLSIDSSNTGSCTVSVVSVPTNGTRVYTLTCKSITTNTCSFSVYISVSSSREISFVYAINEESGELVDSSSTDIYLAAGTEITFSGYAVTTENVQDTQGVRWTVNSPDASVTYVTSESKYITITADTNSISGNVSVFCFSQYDSTKYTNFTIHVQEIESYVTSITMTSDNGDTISPGEYISLSSDTQVTFYAHVNLDIGGTSPQGVTWTTIPSAEYISSTTTITSLSLQTGSPDTDTSYYTVKCASVKDPSYTFIFYVRVLMPETVESIVVTDEDNNVIEDGGYVYIPAGQKYTLYAKVYYDSGNVDDEGVSWTVGDELIIEESSIEHIVIVAGNYTENASSIHIICRSISDTNCYTSIYVRITELVPDSPTPYSAMIYNNGAWCEYAPFICDSNLKWVELKPDIYPFCPIATVYTANGANYGFSYQYNESFGGNCYVSQNAGQASTAAVCVLEVQSFGGYELYVDCINYAENNYDYGILSNIGSSLSTSNTADSSGVMYSFYGKNSTSVVSVGYGVLAAGTHYIYIKYRKDGSVNRNNDALLFVPRFVKI